MNLKKFAVFTLIGSTIWNTALTYIGVKLGEEWNSIRKYSGYFDAVVVIVVIVAIIAYWKKRKSAPSVNDP